MQPQIYCFRIFYPTTAMKALSTPLLVVTLALTLIAMVLAQDTNLHRVEHAFNDADVSAPSRQ